MTAYYNEHDPFAAAWLRELIKAGHIAPGTVDERSIEDVRPDELAGFTQCHFFAGIGVWSYALRNAGWPDNRPIWTGSCPCQPFSAAGKGGGFADERHLWPAFFHLIGECDPAIVIGEQVASKDGLAWLDLVRADVEGTGRAFAAADLCAAGVGAPHIRQRSYWLAYSAGFGRQWGRSGETGAASRPIERPERLRNACGLAHTDGRDASAERQQCSGQQRQQSDDGGTGWLANTNNQGLEGRRQSGCERADQLITGPAGLGGGLADNAISGRREERQNPRRKLVGNCAQGWPAGSGDGGGGDQSSPTNGFWSDADWLYCRDGKWRPVEPGTFPLAHGAANRVGRLRGYGNAIVAPVAQTFIESVMEITA